MHTLKMTALKGSFNLMDPHPNDGPRDLITVKHAETKTFEVEDAIYKRVVPILDSFKSRNIIDWSDVLPPAPAEAAPAATAEATQLAKLTKPAK